jgi:hypothetical protein
MTVTTFPTPNPLEILVALDSPLLMGLAPELQDLRDKAAGIAARAETEDPKGCSSCAQKRIQLDLRSVAFELATRLEESAVLAAVFPALLTTAKQSTHV